METNVKVGHFYKNRYGSENTQLYELVRFDGTHGIDCVIYRVVGLGMNYTTTLETFKKNFVNYNP